MYTICSHVYNTYIRERTKVLGEIFLSRRARAQKPSVRVHSLISLIVSASLAYNPLRPSSRATKMALYSRLMSRPLTLRRWGGQEIPTGAHVLHFPHAAAPLVKAKAIYAGGASFSSLSLRVDENEMNGTPTPGGGRLRSLTRRDALALFLLFFFFCVYYIGIFLFYIHLASAHFARRLKVTVGRGFIYTGGRFFA